MIIPYLSVNSTFGLRMIFLKNSLNEFDETESAVPNVLELLQNKDKSV